MSRIHEDLECKRCHKLFVNDDPRRVGRPYCSDVCYHASQKPAWRVERTCEECPTIFMPTRKDVMCCSKPCTAKRVSRLRKRSNKKICPTCSKEFEKKKCSKYCSHLCWAQRYSNVTKNCTICGKEFTKEYRFRNQPTCGMKCGHILKGRSLQNRITVVCACGCGKRFETIASNVEAKYCDSEHFYAHRYGRVSKHIKLICEGCGIEYEKRFIHRNSRFHSKSCASTGERNGAFGKPGTMRGRAAWNRGLNKETDERLRLLGEKLSVLFRDKFACGELSHKGVHNPMYEHVTTPEQRKRYSLAAIKRIMLGVSGYKTGHVTGIYSGKKSDNDVRFKSSWELAAMMSWDEDSTVVSYEYEPEFMELPDGRHAVPDFFLKYRDGTSTYIEIKPTAIQQIQSVAEKLDAVRLVLAQRGYSYTLLGNNDINHMIVGLGDEFKNAVECYKRGQ